jgi:hypothetical protein
MLFATLHLMGGRAEAPLRHGLQGAYQPLVYDGPRRSAPVEEVRLTEAPAPPPVQPAPQAEVIPVAFAAAPEPRVTLALPLVDGAAPRATVAEPAAVAGPEPVISYVIGSSVNVRLGPSAQTEALTKLNRGEAVLVLPSDTPGWSMIRIEGDGVEGYIASRFLGEAPQDGLFGPID